MSEYLVTQTPTKPSITQVVSGLLQRACSCGQHTVNTSGECEECKKKSEGTLQRAAVNYAPTQEVPSIVHEVLRSPGQPLDGATRAFMEPRFGHDFSRVRVHTDAKAAESAQAVNAFAYTVGNDVVFGTGSYAPTTSAGRNLVAHELVHVIQQGMVKSGTVPTHITQPSGPDEQEAEYISRAAIQSDTSANLRKADARAHPLVLARRVVPNRVNCPPNVNGAPAAPVADLTAAADRAEMMAQTVAALLDLTAAATRAGLANPGSNVDVAFDNRFGPVPAVPGGFLNRLTGVIRPTQEIARSEEMRLMANRFRLIANLLARGFIHYRCNNGNDAFGGCVITSCPAGIDAWTCFGVNAIFLCPSFWQITDNNIRATLLIHECSHIIWERVFHGARGSGGNFRHAECYASFVADLFGSVPGTPVCPAP
jgi:hypothetical protein